MYYLQSRYYDPETGRFINADDASLLGANGDFASLNLFVYCGNNPVIREDSGGEAWQLALATGGIIGAGMSWSSLGATVLATLGSITPVGWIVIGTVVVAGVVGSVVYAKGRPIKRPGKRKRYSSKKKAYEAAKKAGGGKEPIKHPKDSHGRNDPHYHPRTRNEYSETPKMPSIHDHYYYPR